MSQADNPASSPRRTLPAPMGIAPRPELALQIECDRLRIENTQLLARVSARESRNAELKAQIERLQVELLALQEEEQVERMPLAQPPSRSQPAPLPVDAEAASSTQALYAPGAMPTGGPTEAAPKPGMGLDFGAVSRLSPAELDTLPYGLICLDARGRVVHYNDTEARLARLPKERVIGKNFFTDVAPCTRVREFEGEFYELVKDPGKLRVRSFDFVFRFKHSEQHVTIVLTPARQRGLFNMAVLRRSVEETSSPRER